MTEKIVVVTGASSGIGEALTLELGMRGHAVVLAARREAESMAVAARSKGRTHVVVADVTKRADVERIRDEAIAKFGHVDVWVNNAGRGLSRPVLELTDADVDDVVSINVKSALYGMQAIVPHFKARTRGQIINVSSFLSKVPIASIRSMYSAAKAALNSLTTNVRMDLAKDFPEIWVTTVLPGVVRTPFRDNALGSLPPGYAPPAASEANAQSAEEVARVIADAIDRPALEVFTNPKQIPLWKAFVEDPGVVSR